METLLPWFESAKGAASTGNLGDGRMQRIFGWLETTLSGQEASAVADRADDPEIVKPDDYTIDLPFRAEVAGWMGSHESVQDEYVDTLPELENLDLDSSDGNKSTGYDPYNNN